jgi:antitoxin CcdA
MSATARKKGTNVYLSVGLIEEAKALDINLSATLDRALADAITHCKRQNWIEENKAGIEALNAFMDDVGLFSDDEKYQVL